jgi:hypothetical protein
MIEMFGERNSLTDGAGCIMDDDDAWAGGEHGGRTVRRRSLIGPRPMCSQKPVKEGMTGERRG